MLPVRNRGKNIPNHVELFTESNGLIHGGIVTTNRYRITCRAYRCFKSGKRLLENAWRFVWEEEVAGWCDQHDANGDLLDTWSTYKLLPEFYEKREPLPWGSDAATFAPSLSGGGRETQGFYITSRYFFDCFLAIAKFCHENPYGTPLPAELVKVWDTGVPALQYMGKVDGAYTPPFPHADEADRESMIEHPFFRLHSVDCPSFPINSAYVKVYSPHRDCDVTIVSIVGARNTLATSPPHARKPNWKRGLREVGWHVRRYVGPPGGS
jgi:hypothetical protein